MVAGRGGATATCRFRVVGSSEEVGHWLRLTKKFSASVDES